MKTNTVALTLLILFMSTAARADPGWAEKIIQSSPVIFVDAPCTEEGGFGQRFGVTGLTGGAQEKPGVAGEVTEAVPFIYKESRPPYSWFEVTRTLNSKKIVTVSALIFFSTRELADQTHTDLVQQLAKSGGIKAITPNPDANQTRLFSRPLVDENGSHMSRSGLMIDIEVVGTMMSIACTDSKIYVREIRNFPPAGFDEKGASNYGLTKIAEVQEPYCTRDMAFGVPFGSIPKPENLDRTIKQATYIRLDRPWPPFTTFRVELSPEGRITEISSFVDFNTHALAHEQTLAIVNGIRRGVAIYDDTVELLTPILHTDPPYRENPNAEYYGARSKYISGLAAEVNDSAQGVFLTCTRRDLKYPGDYEKYRALRDEQRKP